MKLNYVIMGTYNSSTEELDQTNLKEEAIRLQEEYLMAFGKGWNIFIKEVLLEE